MPETDHLPNAEVEQLRATSYTAFVHSIQRCHEELMILRVVPDVEKPLVQAGQYVVVDPPRFTGRPATSDKGVSKGRTPEKSRKNRPRTLASGASWD